MPAAGDNMALPIGYAQTTSCPLVMARMMEMVFAGVPAPAKILEVGVGLRLSDRFAGGDGVRVSVGLERIGALADAARRRLAAYGKVRVRHVDGLTGAQPEAPFAGILVCAECEEIPTALVGQLQEEGAPCLAFATPGKCSLDRGRFGREDFVPSRSGRFCSDKGGGRMRRLTVYHRRSPVGRWLVCGGPLPRGCRLASRRLFLAPGGDCFSPPDPEPGGLRKFCRSRRSVALMNISSARVRP